MEKQRTTKVVALSALIVAIVSITVAFAAMSTTLTINGTAVMQTANWEVRFVPATLTSSTTGAATVTTAPTLTDTTLGTFAVVLTRPGDSIVYTFDVTNAGTINARIGSIFQNGIELIGGVNGTPICTGLALDPVDAANDAALVCGNLTYTLTYTAGGTVSQNDTLTAGQTRNLTLRIAYTGTTLPTDDVQISGLGMSIIYVQD